MCVDSQFRDGRCFRIFLLLTLFFFTTPLVAFEEGCNLLNINEPEFLHQAWRIEDGLPSPGVRAIKQTSDGYLWIRTDEALTLFDGIRFQEVETKTNDNRIGGWVAAIAQTRDGSVWASSVNGGLLRIQNERTTRYTTAEGLMTNYVLSIFEDSRKNLWIGTAAGLSRYEKGRFINYTNHPGLVVEAVRSIIEDSKGNLWIGTAKGVSVMKDGKFQTFTSEDLLISDGVLTVYEDRRGRIWIGTSLGLTCLVDGQPMHYTTDEGLAHNTVRAVLEDRSGNLWIGSQGGLQRFQDGRFSDVRLGENPSSDFEEILFIYSLTEDHEGNLWIGNNHGLNRLKLQKIKTLTFNDGLPHNLVTSVLEDRDHYLWVGTYGGGLARLSDGRFTLFTTNNGLPSNYVLGLWQTSDGSIWIGSDLTGITRFKDGSMKRYHMDTELQERTVRVIFQDSSGTVWIGHNAGLNRLQGEEFVTETNYPTQNVKQIIESRDNTLWVATVSGLTALTRTNIVTYTRDHGLPSDTVNAVFEDSEGYLWVATEHGGIHRKTNSGFSASPPTMTERVVHITEDHLGVLWCATRNGIYSINKRHLNSFIEGEQASVEVVSYGKRDGMKRAQCNGIAQPSGWKTHDGRLWFPTMFGLVVFDPAYISNNDAPPPLAIQSILVDGQSIKPSSYLQLPPGDGQLEFHYAALSFQAPERVRYQYILEGFETNWVDAGSRRFARYTNLRPGEYRFRVKASNNGGVWNEVGLTTTINLAPHFYQTGWFYAACVLGMILCGMGINLLRLRQLQKREHQLSELIERRTAKLQEALRSMERFNYSIAHDLRAPLRAVRGFTQAIAEDYASAFDAVGKEYCQRVEASIERMDLLIDDLLTYGRLTHTEIHLGWVDTETVLTKVMCDFQAVIHDRKAQVEIIKPLPRVWANETLLEQILSNLVGNALKFVEKGTRPSLRIWAEEKKNCTRLYIKDNGIGIAAEHHERIFRVFERLHGNEVFPGTGIGLAIVDKAAERMEGRVGVISELGKGSCFWIELSKSQNNPK